MANIDIPLLRHALARFGLTLEEQTACQLDAFCGLLLEANRHMNLTAVTDPEGMTVKHLLDSLLLLWAAPPEQGAALLDVGSGAGFPAVPLALARPDLRVTLLDSTKKRVEFLADCCQTLRLPATALHARAEEAARRRELRERFDLVTARAVAALPVLSELCLPFVQLGGVFAALKGGAVEEELGQAEAAIRKLGGKVERVARYTLTEDGENARSIVIVRKISQTPTAYPRTFAKISAEAAKILRTDKD